MTKRADISARLSVVFGLPEPEAAAAIGISQRKFRDLVADKRIPRPRRIDGRLVWDVDELHAAFKEFPHDGPDEHLPAGGDDGWDDVL